jgi:hypothetical protein
MEKSRLMLIRMLNHYESISMGAGNDQDASIAKDVYQFLQKNCKPLLNLDGEEQWTHTTVLKDQLFKDLNLKLSPKGINLLAYIEGHHVTLTNSYNVKVVKCLDQQSGVYTIFHKDSLYIGSCLNFRTRLQSHFHNYRMLRNEKESRPLYNYAHKVGGFERFS